MFYNSNPLNAIYSTHSKLVYVLTGNGTNVILKYLTACSTGSVQEVGWSGQLWAPVDVSIYHG